MSSFDHQVEFDLLSYLCCILINTDCNSLSLWEAGGICIHNIYIALSKSSASLASTIIKVHKNAKFGTI